MTYNASGRSASCLHREFYSPGDNRPDSDTDILIEIDPDVPVGVYEYVGIKEYIASLFGGPVDVVDREGLKPHVRPGIMADTIYAF